jgi:hypothetical protein
VIFETQPAGAARLDAGHLAPRFGSDGYDDGAVDGDVLVDAAWIASVQAIAAGAILAMTVDTKVPEAFEGTHDFAGLIAVAGFLAAFALSKLEG